MGLLDGRRILLTGGTGSLGQVFTRRILSGEFGEIDRLIILSRDEAKQHYMRMGYHQNASATDEIIFKNFQQKLQFRIGDVRDYHSVAQAARDVDMIVNAAALKQVPTCEYFPYEAVRTNIGGAENIIRAIQENKLAIDTVVGVSTDKACRPVNVMGMTKSIQERVFIQGNMRTEDTRFICTRYGNVLASRGSVIPLFHDQIKAGGPVTITTLDMTRFLLSLDDAVDLIMKAVEEANPGEIYIPRPPAAKIEDIADVLIGDRKIEKKVIGIRPGEKIHEAMIGVEESYWTVERDNYYAILPILPEIRVTDDFEPAFIGEYTSETDLLDVDGVHKLLHERRLLIEDVDSGEGEILR